MENAVFRDLSTFSRTLIFLSSYSFAFLIVFLLPLSSLTLPTSAFPSVHIVESLTSKLPSALVYPYWSGSANTQHHTAIATSNGLMESSMGYGCQIQTNPKEPVRSW